MAGGGTSKERSERTSEQYVFKAQEPYLLDTYARAQKLMNKQKTTPQKARKILKPFIQDNKRVVRNLEGSGKYAQGITRGENYGMQELANLQNTELPGNVLSNNIQGNFNNYLMGAETGDIARDFAQKDAQPQLENSLANFYGSNFNENQGIQLDAAKGYIDSGLNAGLAQGNLMNSLQRGVQGLANLGLTPYNARWQPLQNYAQIVDAPAVLTSSQSTGRGDGYNWHIV